MTFPKKEIIPQDRIREMFYGLAIAMSHFEQGNCTFLHSNKIIKVFF